MLFLQNFLIIVLIKKKTLVCLISSQGNEIKI